MDTGLSTVSRRGSERENRYAYIKYRCSSQISKRPVYNKDYDIHLVFLSTNTGELSSCCTSV